MFTKIKRLILLNILWVVCSIPLITIGASTTAMFYVAMKAYRGEDIKIAKDFFKSFKQNFLQATVLWVIVAAVGAVVGIVLYKAFAMTGNFSRLAEVVAAVIAIFYAITIVYIFPILARYDNSIWKTIRFSIAVAAVNFGTTTIFIVLWVIAGISTYIVPQIGIAWVIIGNILIADYMAKSCMDIFTSVAKSKAD